VQSFETVLLLVPRPPLNDDWDNFLNDVRRRNTEPPINGFAQVYKGSAVRNAHGQCISPKYKHNETLVASYHHYDVFLLTWDYIRQKHMTNTNTN